MLAVVFDNRHPIRLSWISGGMVEKEGTFMFLYLALSTLLRKSW